MKAFFSLLAASAVIAQPAIAQEITIRCNTISDMKIYNPHGRGGIIGGPTDHTWTVRTDGRTASVSGGKGSVEAKEVELNSSGLSWCGADQGVPCGTTETLNKSDGRYNRRVARTSISTGGEFRWDMSVFNSSASMKTGVTVEEYGECDGAGIADLRRLAETGDASSNSDRDSDREGRSGKSADDSSSSDDRDDSRADDRSSDDSSNSSSDDSSSEDAARAEAEAREQAEREEKARAEEDERAKAEERRTADRERRERQQAEQRAEEEKAAKEKADAEKRKREEEEARKEAERKRKEEEANRLIEFKEGVVLCEKGSGRESRCYGPLQMTIVEVKTLDDPATRGNVGMACGSDRSLRDLGMVNSMRAFGCGFGIHPSPSMSSYPGNTDVAARYGVYISDRGTYRCKKSVSAYCRGQ